PGCGCGGGAPRSSPAGPTTPAPEAERRGEHAVDRSMPDGREHEAVRVHDLEPVAGARRLQLQPPAVSRAVRIGCAKALPGHDPPAELRPVAAVAMRDARLRRPPASLE